MRSAQISRGFIGIFYYVQNFFILQSGSCSHQNGPAAFCSLPGIPGQKEKIPPHSPEAFVKEKGRFPIIDKIENPDGGVVIVTGDGKGYMVRYTFSE